MKIIINSILIFLIFCNFCHAQLGDILKKIPGVGDVFEEAVTTSIKDAYPQANWLSELDKQLQVVRNRKYSGSIEPGYYRFNFKTFCLHAGTYAPTEGSGYLVAPLKGSKAKLISNILRRYGSHPEINQKDVQMLIWGIEAGQKFSNYPVDFQLRVKSLLEASEIALMEVDVKEISMDLLPQEVKDVLNLYHDMRNKLSDAQATYEDIERIAVRTGIPPLGKGSKNIPGGTWTSVGNGVYIRAFPQSYSLSEVEFYIPQSITINKDSQNRIISLGNGSSSFGIEYDGNNISKLKGFTEINVSNQFVSEADEFVKLVKSSLKKSKASKLDIKKLSLLKRVELILSSSGNDEMHRIAVDAVNDYISEVESNKKGGSRTAFDPANYVYAPANTSQQRLGSSGEGTGENEAQNENQNQNPEKEKEKKECKVNALIHQVNETDLPEPDKVYNVSVDIFIEGNDENCNAEEIKFTLFDVTTEPGRYLNDRENMTDGSPDLVINSGYTNPDYNVTDRFTASKPLSGKSQSVSVNITSNDYGAYGKLRASVKVKGNWYEADADGAPDKFITIPVDFNNNKIADSWEKQNGVLGLAADWDEDPNPSGQARNGDGITNYEEYRGFRVMSGDNEWKHVRTNPKEKEIFVIDDGGIFDFAAWRSASGIKAYRLSLIDVYQYNGGTEFDPNFRWVNFCRGYAQGLKYAAYVRKIDGVIDPVGLCEGYEYWGCNSGSPVKNANRTVILPGRIANWLAETRDTVAAWLAKTPKGIVVDGKFYDGKIVKKYLDILNNEAKFNEIVNFLTSVSALHEVGHALGADHHGKDKIKESGDKNCPMRYTSFMDPVGIFSKKLANILDQLDKEGVVITSYASWKFCKSPDNCWSKLDANDR